MVSVLGRALLKGGRFMWPIWIHPTTTRTAADPCSNSELCNSLSGLNIACWAGLPSGKEYTDPSPGRATPKQPAEILSGASGVWLGHLCP